MATDLFETIDDIFQKATSPTLQTEHSVSQELAAPLALPFPGRRPAGR
jgi:hypothetical protein